MKVEPTSIVYKNVLPWRGCEKLYLDDRTADVYFVFESDDKDDIKIPAHKNILSVNSPVFDAMFYGSMKQGGDISIVDTSPEAFKEFLQFFYLSTVVLTIENRPKVLNLGEQYMLDECKNASTQLSKATLTMDNLCWGYELAIFFEQDELTEFCEKKIRENPKEIFLSNSFQSCESNVLRRILQLDSLKCDETVVFDGCIEWAKEACVQKGLDETNMQNLRDRLGDLFYEIRFGDMTTENFFSRYRLYDGLFSMEEFKDIIGMIASKDYQPPKFNRKPRTTAVLMTNEILICERIDPLATAEANKYQVCNWDYTVFGTTKPLLLKKIDCSEVFNELNLLSIPSRVTIFELTNERNILYVRQIALSPKCETIIELPKPIKIKPDIKYGIVFEIRNESCYNVLVHKSHVQIDDDVVITFYDHKLQNVTISCQKYGLVTRLHFSKEAQK